MAIQKKHGKGRLDKWYKLAKEKGYRARAAFKLIQLNKKYNFLEKSNVLIDLCAAPGSWCQVASEVMPPNSLIVGVDLVPIKPIPRCITFGSDITTDKCRATLRQHLKTLKADVVLHDGAPNVGIAWVQDAFTQAELTLQSMKLATEFLRPGGTFVSKVFRSKDYNSLLWVFNQLFEKVEATKPPSSRNVSAEIFVVCRGFKAPKHLDAKFVDPRHVFAELAAPTPNNEAKVFNPEQKKRKRDGYEEGDWTQYKEATVSEFIQTTDPIAMLGSMNKLTFEQKPNGDIAQATIDKLPETTVEIRACCGDLRVLGRSDFKRLLRWRLKLREIFGFSSKQKAAGQAGTEGEETAEIEPMDEELLVQKELHHIREQENAKKKKERRKENERKQKEIQRLQMHMTTPMEIGMEQAGPHGEGAMFQLKPIDKAGSLSRVAKGRMAEIVAAKAHEESVSEHDDSDPEADLLEIELDVMYDEYQERKMASDAKYRAKKARRQKEAGEEEEFNGFSDDAKDVSSDEEIVEDLDSSSEGGDEHPISLVTDLAPPGKTVNGLTRRAAMFFDQEIFQDMGDLDAKDKEHGGIDAPAPSSSTNMINVISKQKQISLPILSKQAPHQGNPGEQSDDGENGGFDVVKRDESKWEQDSVPMKDGRPDIDIITAEAMTLAHELASGKKTKQSLLDDNFNRYSHRDTDGLPDWFLDDENKHSKLQRPITAAAAAAIKEKLRAVNARPIKKVAEAKARKKLKAAQRLEKLKKKSALLADDEGMTEKEKAQSIARMMSKAAKRKPKKKIHVVVASGSNKGVKGRPRGTRGRYKMVDARLKKDVRAQKRIAKRKT